MPEVAETLEERGGPLMSVKRKVTVPVGRAGIGGLRSDARAKPAEGTFGDQYAGSSGWQASKDEPAPTAPITVWSNQSLTLVASHGDS